MNGLSKSIIYLAIKLGEVGSYLASMYLKVEAVHQGKAQRISNTQAKIARLENIFWAEVKDLKAQADNRIQ